MKIGNHRLDSFIDKQRIIIICNKINMNINGNKYIKVARETNVTIMI